jgi:hypothetical protein
MTAAKQFTCPTCGFTIATPTGMDELVKFVTMHKDENHPEMQMSQEQFMSLVKDVQVMGAEPMKKMGRKGKVEQKEESEAWKAQENVGKRFRGDKS